MDLKSLGYFVAIVETGSFMKAALSFNVSQPALSKAIAQLETECGVQLLKRGRRGTKLALTEAGELVVRRGQVMIAERKSLLDELEVMKSRSASGRVDRE